MLLKVKREREGEESGEREIINNLLFQYMINSAIPHRKQDTKLLGEQYDTIR